MATRTKPKPRKKTTTLVTGYCRQKRNGRWWFVTIKRKKVTYLWPIGNHSQASDQQVTVVKRAGDKYCFIPVQLELFQNP